MVVISVYTYGVKIIKKFRWESGFLWGVPWNPPLCTNGSAGYLMQLSVKVLLSLKVVKFETKMYLNFSNFQGRTWAGGGTCLGPKTGISVRWGGLTKFSLDKGKSQSPRKKPCTVSTYSSLIRTAPKTNAHPTLHPPQGWCLFILFILFLSELPLPK